MVNVLELCFTKVDGTGRKTVKIPNPPVDIDTKTTQIENHMTSYCEGLVVDYPVFDEAIVVEHNETVLIDLIGD